MPTSEDRKTATIPCILFDGAPLRFRLSPMICDPNRMQMLRRQTHVPELPLRPGGIPILAPPYSLTVDNRSVSLLAHALSGMLMSSWSQPGASPPL